MTGAVTLRRVDPSRNMARFYRLDVQPDLFGGCSFVREWGRIGRGGTCASATILPRPTTRYFLSTFGSLYVLSRMDLVGT